MKTASSIGKRLTVLLGMVLFVGVVGALTPGDTFANGTTFSNDKLDLKIDSKAWYNGVLVPSATWSLKDLTPGTDKFFNFSDVKPGDFGCNVISIHAQKSDAYACLDFTNLKSAENGVNEPESAVDPNGSASGELASGTEMFGWIDNGNGVYNPPSEKPIFGTSINDAADVLNDTTYVIGDSKHGSSCKQGSTKYVGICWCAGKLTVNPVTGKMVCDGTALGNAAQTDSFSVDVLIRATGAKDSPQFLCGSKPPKGNNGVGNGEDPPPPGIGNAGNDGPGTGPGHPGGSDTSPGNGSGNWHEASRSGFHWPFSFNWNPFGNHKS